MNETRGEKVIIKRERMRQRREIESIEESIRTEMRKQSREIDRGLKKLMNDVIKNDLIELIQIGK